MDNLNQDDHNLDLAASEGPVLSPAEGEFTSFNQASYLPNVSDTPLDLDHELTAAPDYPELPAAEAQEELVAPQATILVPKTASASDESESKAEPEQTTPVLSETEGPVPSENELKTNLSDQQLALIKNLIDKIEDNTRQIKNILEPYSSNHSEIKIKLSQDAPASADKDTDSQVIEGVFNGQLMIGPDGHEYSVPANYASKSKLVEGDILKLIITRSGAFIFKQIQPIDRRRVTGLLEETETGDFFVMAEDRRWHVLSASVTYYKGESGDQAVIVIPRIGLSKWAAVENIIKR